jgi:hypothetical protein
MLKEYIVVILLHLLLIRETKAKDDTIEWRQLYHMDTDLDNAIGNCSRRPKIRTKLFSANPPVSH